MLNVAIREARAEDCGAVLDLWQEAGAGPSITDTVEHLQMLTETCPDLFLVAEAGGGIAGTILGG